MKKILIIEDEKALAEEVCEILAFEGYDVLLAENGKIGIEMAIEHHPDLILCDIMMPVMDGIRVIYELKAHEETTLIPFIFMSALAERQSIRNGMDLGADDYLVKPFSHDELLQTIETRLKKQDIQRLNLDQTIDTLRDQIMTMLPHELRTPLSSIIGFGSLLSQMADKFSTEDIAEMGKDILDAGNKLHRLTENYLIYIQLKLNEKTNQEITESSSVEPIIHDITYQLGKTYRRENQTIVLMESAPALSISETFLRKILLEIIDNAYKFSPCDSKVIIQGTKEGGTYNISISDQGCGMNQKQIDQIGAFMQFDRADKEQQGNGLGLAIACKMVSLSGGRLQIMNPEAKGTKVTVEVALA